MKVAIATVAYREERFIAPFITHYKDKVDEILVLNSTKPWFGEDEGDDRTATIARDMGASVIEYDWRTEHEQRNAGQEYLADYTYILIIDPDEFISDDDFAILLNYLEREQPDAATVAGQYTLWKNGYVADPPRDYLQLIAVKPDVRFVEKRIVDRGFSISPVWVWHFSWARTDEECWRKISHYAHANDFDIKDWYDNVWLKWRTGMIDVHPTSPETLHKLIPAILPPEIEKLNLWP